MSRTGRSDLYGLFGHPVSHSLSPQIHERFAQQTGQDLRYVAVDVAAGEFNHEAEQFHRSGGLGLNVTLPYKTEAAALADELTGRASTAGVVNTLLWREGGALIGDNTDGAGLVTDLTRNIGFDLAGVRVLLLGAGGAASGSLAPLLAETPAEIVVANRSVERAEQLTDRHRGIAPSHPSSYRDLEGSFDLVINATSASLKGDVPPLPPTAVRPDTLCYDMLYGSELTSFLVWAGDQGVERLADGSGMLVEQAAESFFLWRGLRPDTGPVLDWLRRRSSLAAS